MFEDYSRDDRTNNAQVYQILWVRPPSKELIFLHIAKEEQLMNDIEKKRIVELKAEGKSIRDISSLLNIPRSTIGTYIKNLETVSYCKCCGKSIAIKKGHRSRAFCSDSCRYKFWRSTNNSKNKTTNYVVECLCCQKKFYSYRSLKRKFCSRACYDSYRKGGGGDEAE